MVWVLWDIFIPLLTSFALGTLLAWLVWRHRTTAVATTATSTAMADGMAFAADTASRDSSSDSELESANIILIGERDKAALALEGLQEETDAMKQRIAELEADNLEKDKQLSSTATDAVDATDPTDRVDTVLSDSATADSHASEELQRVQADLDSLNDTLDKERSARRATELELLNTRNRHEKLVAENTSTVSEEQHQREITDRDEQIENLKQQLASRDEATAIDPPQVQEEQTEPSPPENTGATRSENTDATRIEKTGAARIENTVTTSGYTPKGWAVPDTAPVAADRDKLTAIKGVGNVLEKILHDCGIYFYHQLANLDAQGMDELQAQIPQFPGRIQRDKWVEQAKELQQEKELVES